MKDKRLMKMTLLIVMAILFGSIASTADDWNRMTTVVFTEPVQIPGMVLQPGMYVFKIPELTGNHNIVQIWNADQTMLYATVLCWTEYVYQPPNGNVFTFEPREEGAPMALKTWFHRGNPNGAMFIYSRRELGKER
jgi:hypothetical protein